MSTAIAIEASNVGTPRFVKSRSRPVNEPQDDVTPVAFAHTPAALRGAFELFSANLDPIHNSDLVRVVVGVDGRQLVTFSHSALDSPLFVVNVAGLAADPAAIADGSSDALMTFNRVALELGLNQREMFAVTGIRKRTFHSWKSKSASSRPRLASVGQLWTLADTVEELRSIVDRPLAVWLNGSPERRSALLGQRWAYLIDSALGIPRDRPTTMGDVPNAGVGSEVDLPIIRSEQRPESRTVQRGLSS